MQLKQSLTILKQFGGTLCLLCLLVQAGAQSFVFDNNPNQSVDMGAFVKKASTEDVYDKVTEGFPWLLPYWCRADMVTEKGQTVKGIYVKLDLIGNRVFYTQEGSTMELMTPLRYLFLHDSLRFDTLKMVQASYLNIPASSGVAGWLQLYTEGKAMLLRDMDKKLFENKPIGSAVTNYEIQENFTWVLWHKGQVHTFKKLKEAEGLLSGWQPVLKNFKYTTRGMENQLMELVSSYNKIP